MLDDFNEAHTAEVLDCRPIRGVDLPMKQNQRNKNVGLGGAEIVEVLNMDQFMNPHPQKAELGDEAILQMLLPTQLKAP